MGSLNQLLIGFGPEKERLALETLLDVAEVCVQRASASPAQAAVPYAPVGGAGGDHAMYGVARITEMLDHPIREVCVCVRACMCVSVCVCV
jgi:hypothetical protein